jgi:hypothetical protein
MTWQVLSEFLGFAGSLMMVAPYLRHQPLRDVRDLFRRARLADPDAQEAVRTSTDALDVYFHRWNRRDYLLVTAGVSFLCVSFFVSLIRSLVSG